MGQYSAYGKVRYMLLGVLSSITTFRLTLEKYTGRSMADGMIFFRVTRNELLHYRQIALQANEGKSLESTPPGPRPRVGAY